ncbi:MAG: T9SS type A sorting domain-containing protein [Bacteroidia bacterium]|nr:T9SS type A sorting domain-containing protein [Bacteroidia bacterium]
MKKTTSEKTNHVTNKRVQKIILALFILLSGFAGQKAQAQCTANFTFFQDSLNPGMVQFIDGSTTSVGSILSYNWDYGDGSTDTGFVQNPSHLYSSPGTYMACLIIGTDQGCQDTFCVAVTVQPVAQSISVDLFADSSGVLHCTAPADANFILSGQANGFGLNDSVQVFISYGDGTDSTFYLQIPQRYFFSAWMHTYVNSGTYTATVIVSAGGFADTLSSPPIIVNATCGPLSGTVYLDNNLDCIFNSGDATLANIRVSLSAAGSTIAWAYTDSNGVYSFNAPTGTTYEVILHLNNGYGGSYTATCPSTGVITVASLPSSGNDFYVGCPNGFDLTGSISIFGIVPGRAGSVCVFAYDRFCNTPAGQLKLILDPMLTAVPDSTGSYTISGDTLIWNYNPNSPYWNYCATVMTATTATIGDTACLTFIIEPLAGDANPADNVITKCEAVRTSWDPNDKAGVPFGQGSNNAILPGTEITYTIRFQNTGTAEAYDVYILDTLDQNLDLNTYQVLAASHAMVPSILQDNVLRFTFANIHLPDSNANEPASHGYVTYRISPVSGVPDGTVLNNTAGIYFDYNPAVITNTTQHTIDYTLGLSKLTKSGGLQISPNPAKDNVLIQVEKNGLYNFQVINILGAVVYTAENLLDKVQVNTSTLPAGIYLVRAENGSESYQSRLVISH